jgi:hypothetical protein
VTTPTCTCLPLNARLMAHLLKVDVGSVHEQGCWESAYRQGLGEVVIGPIEHSNPQCQKEGCECWCQACERHNWRHAQVTA